MDPNSPTNNADSLEEARSQEIQNLKTYLLERFGKLPVLPGDPRSIPGNFDLRNHAAPRLARDLVTGNVPVSRQDSSKFDEGTRKLNDRETASAVSALTREANLGNDAEYFRHPTGKGDPNLIDCSKTGRGASKSVRFTYSTDQVEALITAFNINPYPTRLDRENLECMLGLSAERIKNWFQNRRSKERRKAKQNNTPLPTPLLMRDKGLAPQKSYPSHPHMLQFVKPPLVPSATNHPPNIFGHYLRHRLPNVMMPTQTSLQPHTSHSSHSSQQIGGAQITAYKPNWTVPWPGHPYHVASRTTSSSGASLPPSVYSMSSWQNSTWPSYYYDGRYITHKAHTATSENGHASDTVWSPPPPSLSHRPMYPLPANRPVHVVGDDFEECLAPTRPPSQLTWYEDIERPVDVRSVEDTGEESSLHLEDSASGYSVADTSQSDASSYRSLLDDSTQCRVESNALQRITSQPNFTPVNSQTNAESTSPFPILPIVPTSNGQFVNYSPVGPPLAQDLDPGCPSGLEGYSVFAYASEPTSFATTKDLQSVSVPSIDNQEPQESDSSELEDEDDDATE